MGFISGRSRGRYESVKCVVVILLSREESLVFGKGREVVIELIFVYCLFRLVVEVCRVLGFGVVEIIYFLASGAESLGIF